MDQEGNIKEQWEFVCSLIHKNWLGVQVRYHLDRVQMIMYQDRQTLLHSYLYVKALRLEEDFLPKVVITRLWDNNADWSFCLDKFKWKGLRTPPLCLRVSGRGCQPHLEKTPNHCDWHVGPQDYLRNGTLPTTMRQKTITGNNEEENQSQEQPQR